MAVTITVLITILVGALVGASLGLLTGAFWWCLGAGIVIGAVAGWSVLRGGVAPALRALGARPLAPGEQPRLENVVDGFCVTNGLAQPSLHLVEVSAPNAAVLGGPRGEGALVVTAGLLDELGRIELEAVVYRELLLVKSGAARLATSAIPLARLSGRLLRLVLPRRHDVEADLMAVGLTRYPPALIAALEKLEQAGAAWVVPRWTRHLLIGEPGGSGGGRHVASHSPIDERIATLREL